MWNKYRSLFMLVRVRTGQFNLSFPLALFLLDQTFDMLSDLVWVWERLTPNGAVRSQSTGKSARTRALGELAIIPSEVLKLCRELVLELRCHGKWRMVEVEAKGVRVYVDFI